MFNPQEYWCGSLVQLVYLAFITPVMCDFYNYEMGSPQFVQLFTQFSQVFFTPISLSSFDLFHQGSCYQVLWTCDNSIVISVQNLALYGALLFFIGMKSSIPWRKSKRRAVKTKTTWWKLQGFVVGFGNY
jgi:hypothetical protein